MIKIELDDRDVRQALDRLARRVNNLTPALHDVGQALMEGSRQRISEGRDWQGRPFAPNSPFTLARKRGNKPLVDTGNLVGSVFPACAGMNRHTGRVRSPGICVPRVRGDEPARQGRRGGQGKEGVVNLAAIDRVAGMLESILSYANDHAWAGWMLVGLLFAPPILISFIQGERGISPIGTMLGWWALVFIVALVLA